MYHLEDIAATVRERRMTPELIQNYLAIIQRTEHFEPYTTAAPELLEPHLQRVTNAIALRGAPWRGRTTMAYQ